MIKLKSNTKVKIISLLSAITLWMYVIAIVDPEDTKLIEDIPVKITNMEQINDENLIIYQDEPLVCSMYISGKLSNVKSISKDDIQVYGEVSNPIEGKNIVYLKANMSERVTHEFSSSSIIVNLEKKIVKDTPVKISIPDKYKDIVESVQPLTNTVEVSGPREQISKVSYVTGNINPEGKKEDYKEKVEIRAVDKDGREVENVSLEETSIYANVKLFSGQSVLIEPVFSDSIDSSEYRFEKEKIEIKGSDSKISEIESIKTEIIDTEKLKRDGSLKIGLVIPDGVVADEKEVVIFYNNPENIVEEKFNISKNDIQLRNNNRNISIEKFDISDNIEIVIKRYKNNENISENDINLYINMDGYEDGKTEYKIEYSVNFDVESIEIKPNIAILKH